MGSAMAIVAAMGRRILWLCLRWCLRVCSARLWMLVKVCRPTATGSGRIDGAGPIPAFVPGGKFDASRLAVFVAAPFDPMTWFPTASKVTAGDYRVAHIHHVFFDRQCASHCAARLTRW